MTISILQYVRERRYSQASIPDGQLALWDIVFELARRVDALESGVQEMHVAPVQNGSGETNAAPIAVGQASIWVDKWPHIELDDELQDDVWTHLLAAGLNELAVRVVIYANTGDESEVQA